MTPLRSAPRLITGLACMLALAGLLVPDLRVHAQPQAATSPAPRGGVPAGHVLRALPAEPDPRASYVFYLHGRIVEQQGANAVSPEFGRYEYDAILEALARAGHEVISEVRPATTAVPAYARTLVGQLRALLTAGVPATRITVIGASKGGAIAIRASQSLANADIGYVLLGSCSSDEHVRSSLHGDVLSIYEASDPLAHSCGGLFAKSPALGARRELQLHTQLKHGFLYRPLNEWVGPALAWTDPAKRSQP